MTTNDIDIFEKELEDRTMLCCALADKDVEIESLRSRLAEAQTNEAAWEATAQHHYKEARAAETRLAEAERDADRLREAAGKVTCKRCDDSGVEPWSDFGSRTAEPCPDCADLRRLLGENT